MQSELDSVRHMSKALHLSVLVAVPLLYMHSFQFNLMFDLTVQTQHANINKVLSGCFS